MAENTSASAPAQNGRLPRGVPFIIGNEAAERFSYYGMMSILTIYLSRQLNLGDVEGKKVVHLFATAVYFLPLFGAWLADKWLGRYWTILTISMFYCAGHGALALFEGNKEGVYLGLILIAIGAGGIKPCVSALVGDQFPPGNEKGLTRVYGWFYWSINFGATFGFALIPMLRDKHGYSWAFGVPGIAMAVATFIFWLGRKKYVRVPPARPPRDPKSLEKLFWTFLVIAVAVTADTLCVYFQAPLWRRMIIDAGAVVCLFGYLTKRLVTEMDARNERPDGKPVTIWWYALGKQSSASFWDRARAKFSDESIISARAVSRIFLVFLTVPVFFALYNQVNTTWVLQGEKMTPFQVPIFYDFANWFGGGVIRFKVDGERMQAVGSILVMIWVPLLTYLIYPFSEKAGLRPTPLRRMGLGMVLAGVTYVISGWMQGRIDAGEQLSLAWQLLPYIVLVAGEVLVSATGLEFAFAEAPPSLRSMMMSLWLLTIAGGHFLIAIFTDLNARFVKASGAKELYFYAALMFVVSLIFMGIATWVGKQKQVRA